jgi:putative ABC transport system permease protein
VRDDLIYAFRGLRKNPAFTIVAILSLAIGIGANTTIFTFVNAVLLRPLPYPGSARIVTLNEHSRDSAAPLNVHPANFVEWRARAKSFESLALVQAPPLNLVGPNGAEQIARMMTTSDLFAVFGVGPAIGRAFTEADTRPGSEAVVILGHRFWQRWFGGDPSVVGRQLPVQGGPLRIVGIAPAGFKVGLMEPDALTPLTIDPADPAKTGSRAFQCYARLASGVRLDQAKAEMSVIAAALREHPVNKGMGVLVFSLHESLAREARPALRLLMAVVVTVLAIACVNLAGLLMARGVARRGEFALRAALGASRRRLVRQLLIESFVLSGIGGLAGLTLASWASGVLAALTAGALTASTGAPIRLDSTVLIFTLLVTSATAFAFGLVPARQASRTDPQSALQERSRGGSADRRHHRVRHALVISEVALALVLLVGAGLFLRTFSSLLHVDLGFQPSNAVTMGLFLGIRPPEARIAAIDQILDRVANVPSVKAAGTIQFLPLRQMTCGTGFWREEDAGRADPAQTLPTECALVSRGYFAAMGIPVLEGRAFDRQDRINSPRVLLVNQAFVKRYFPDGRAIGRRIFVQSSNQALAEIVGVAGDVRHNGLTTDPAPVVFLLHAQTPGYITSLVVRTDGDPLAQTAAIRRAIHEADPSQAVSAVRTLDQDVANALARPRLNAILVTLFAALAVLLAAIGVYGLIAFIVTQRTHEIGIRLALGATREKVFLELFAQGARLVVIGLGIGLAVAVAVRKSADVFVFGVTTADPITYIVAASALAAVALAAIVLPARRAASIEPGHALRAD